MYADKEFDEFIEREIYRIARDIEEDIKRIVENQKFIEESNAWYQRITGRS